MVTLTSDGSSEAEGPPLDPQCSSGSYGGQSSTSTARSAVPKPLARRCIIDNPLFNAALDRTQTTTRKAMLIVAPALAAVGFDVKQLSLSQSSLKTARNSSREIFAATVRQNFQPTVPLVAHFDGKLLPCIDGVKRDFMPIVVSGFGVEKLLGIPTLPTGSGAVMGQKVIEFVHEWSGVEGHLAGLCFDTTAGNTGIHTGALTIIQRFFSRRLLFLGCRHHILEICAAAVFDAFFVSKGPEIEVFARMKSQWGFIDQMKFSELDSDKDGEGCLSTIEKNWLEHRRPVVVCKLRRYLDNTLPRDDYRELARLTLILLGEKSDNGTSFSAPGAYHRARWMAKGILPQNLSISPPTEVEQARDGCTASHLRVCYNHLFLFLVRSSTCNICSHK